MIILGFLLLFVCIFVLGILVSDEDYAQKLLLIALAIWAVLFYSALTHNYKQGQIDALTGKIKYELVTNPDSSKAWEEIK